MAFSGLTICHFQKRNTTGLEPWQRQPPAASVAGGTLGRTSWLGVQTTRWFGNSCQAGNLGEVTPFAT